MTLTLGLYELYAVDSQENEEEEEEEEDEPSEDEVPRRPRTYHCLKVVPPVGDSLYFFSSALLVFGPEPSRVSETKGRR